MNCAKCGAEIRLDSVYCVSCGQPAQIVPDYNILDDDFLMKILDETAAQEEAAAKRDMIFREGEKARREALRAAKAKKKAIIRSIIIAVVVLLLIAAACVYMYLSKRHKELTSFDYYMEQAEAYLEDEDYTQALEYFDLAMSAEDAVITVDMYMTLGEIYWILEDYDTALEYFYLVLEEDPENRTIYEYLIEYYLSLEDYDALEELQSTAPNATILALFDGLLLEIPSFSLTTGTYDDDISLELWVDDDSLTIYYTTDGSDPRDESENILYTKAITISKTKTIRAVAMDSKGNYSRISQETFTISYTKPSQPIISPSGGEFTILTYISMAAEAGSTIYYTWDGTTPTTESLCYTEPIAIPEGKNILTVLVVDKHGLNSDISQYKYSYIPEDSVYTEEDTEAAE